MTAVHRFLILVLVACDLAPPPPKATQVPASPPVPPAPVVKVTPTPPPPITPPAVITPPVVVDAGVPVQADPDAGLRPDAGSLAITPACMTVATRFARIYIDSEKRLAEHAVLEQARPRMISRTAEACSSQQWSQQTLDCFNKAQARPDLDACSRALKGMRTP